MKKRTPYYFTTSITETTINSETGEIIQRTQRLSEWYTNEELFTNTRARRRIARKLYANNPLFAWKVMKEAIPNYEYDTFWRDIKPGKKLRGRKPYSAKKEWIRQRINQLESLNHRQINTLIDQMYNGPDWKMEVITSDGLYTLIIDRKISATVLQDFVSWINLSRRSIKDINQHRKALGI